MPDPELPILNTEIEHARRSVWNWWQLTGTVINISIIAIIIILPVKYFVAQPFIVEGGSMVPALQPHDYLVIDEFTYLTQSPQRGDIVVFKYPLDPSLFFIKRLVGMPGETVAIKDGVVWIKRKHDIEAHVLTEPYVLPINAKDEDSTITLGAHEYFMLGDNRAASFDSRIWGPVPARNIVGRTVTRVFPFAHAEMFPGAYHFAQ